MRSLFFGGTVSDVRLAWRSLVRHPVFALISLLSTALGVGGCALAFAVTAYLHWRPLPFQSPGQLVEILDDAPDVVSSATADAWSRELSRVAAVARWRTMPLTVVTPAGAIRATAAAVDTGFFRILGSLPRLGAPVPDALERQPGSVILSHGLWERHFGGDSALIGRSVLVSEREFRVVGVMPSVIDYPSQAQLWVLDAEFPSPGARRAYSLLARAQTQSAMPQLLAIAKAQSPSDGASAVAPSRAWVRSVASILRPEMGRGTFVLLAGSACLFLIATLNTLVLFLGRAVERRHGMAVRVALGSTGIQLARLFVVEAVLVGVLGGLAGFGMAAGILKLIAWIGWFERAGVDQIAIGSPGLVVALGVGLLSATLAAALPPLLAGQDVGALLRAGGTIETRAVGRVRDGLVVVEVAVALLLSVSAAFLYGTYASSQRVALAFRVDGVSFASVSLPPSLSPADRQVLVADLLSRLRSTPAIAAATAWGTFYPNVGRTPDEAITLEGIGAPQRYAGSPSWSFDVDPEIFRTLDLRMTRGRAFDASDTYGAQPVVILTEAACAQLWPGQDPLGRRIKLGPPSEPAPWMTVVGVVENTQPLHGLAGRYATSGSPRFNIMFRPLAQGEVLGQDFSSPPGFAIAILPRATDEVALGALRQSIEASHPSAVIEFIGSLRNHLNRAGDLDLGRMVSQTIFVTCAIAIALALVGVAAVVREALRRRRHEFGIRLALGAQPAALVRLVVRDATKLGFIGAGLGGVLSMILLLTVGASMVRDSQPGAVSGAGWGAIAMTLVALVASAVLLLVGGIAYLQARTVSDIDPAVVLQAE